MERAILCLRCHWHSAILRVSLLSRKRTQRRLDLALLLQIVL